MAADRSYSGPGRAIGIVLRTAHIATMALLVGAHQFAAPEVSLRLWRTATVATGVGLLLTEVSHSRHWIYQGRGVLTLAHVLALALVLLSASLGQSALLAAVVIGSVGSHLPRSLRKWSFRHRRIVD
jgi:hypothetical protein